MISLAEASPRSTPMGAAGAGWVGPGAVLLLALAAVSIGWTGFIASDDELYYGGALRWSEGQVFAGDSHWTTRFPLVLTLAANIKLFGAGPMALHATAAMWFVAFVTATIVLARQIAGDRAGWVAGALAATLPLNATGASIVNCDLPEATFLLLGAAALIGQLDRPRIAHLVAAGMACGLAILCRETGVLALLGYGLLFLAGRPLPRWAWIAFGSGIAAILVGEALFQWALTGDPLHRYGLAAHHDATIDRAANEEGNLLVHPLVDPLIVLLVNNEFGLLFWIAAPAAWALRGRGFDWRRFSPVLALGVASFLLVALLTNNLVLNPRYFTLSATAATILAAAWVSSLSAKQAVGLMALLIVPNLLLLSLQNNHPRWAAEALVLAAAADPAQRITSDPDTRARARQRLEWRGLTNVVADAPVGLVPASRAGTARVLARYPAPYRPLGQVLASNGILIDRLKAGEDMVLVQLPTGAPSLQP
jgi:4-amino-4-deoxy-L-arabinose transferase-like glycosyltransferase